MPNAFKQAQDSLNPDQKAAAEHLDGPLIVIAGPGTGKTQLLSVRIGNILSQTDTSPENILALTFTESGASAMRARLQHFIGNESRKININTYHAFGASVIHAYKTFARNATPNLDTPIDELTQHTLISSIQKSLKHNDILKNDSISDIMDTIASLKSARLSPDDIEKIVAINLAESEGISQSLNPLFQNITKRARFDATLPHYQNVLNALANFVDPNPILGKVEKEANILFASLHQTILDESAKEKPSTSALTRWRDKYFEKDENGNFTLSNIVSNKKLASLANIMRTYESHLKTHGLYDFNDMIEQAITLLKQDKAFAATLAERYQYILLDEFQDTNDSQFELIKLITTYENPNIMAVGDDDQAIYAFQGARYSNLIDFQQHYNAKIITLKTNYRSTQNILDFSNTITAQMEDRFAIHYNIDKTLTAFNQSAGTIERHEFIAAPSEYAFVAAKISDLLRQGAPATSVAVIAPKHKYLLPLLPHLKAHDNINISYEKRENILEDPRITQLLKLSELIVSLADIKPTAQNLLEILSFEFWQLDPVETIRTMQEAKERKQSALDYLAASDNTQLQNLANFFARSAIKSIDTPLEIMLDYLIGTTPLDDFRSPFLEYYANISEYSTFSLYENLFILREKLTETKYLKDFVALAKNYQAANISIINASPYRDSEDAVTLMSAHKSKGLEFKHIFLIACDHNGWGRGKGNNNLLSLPRNLEYVRHTGVTADEQLRLLFVAITRAKTHLYLTHSSKDFTGKTREPLEYLTEDIAPIKHQDETVTEKILQNHWHTTYSPDNPDIAPLLKHRVENYRLSASDLTSYLDVVFSGPEVFYQRKILKSPTESTSTLDYGNLIHKTLDHVTKEKLTDEAAIEIYQNLVREAILADEDYDELLEKGTDNLTLYLESFGDLLRAPTSASEVSFRKENLLMGNIPLTGVIDHLQIDEQNKTITIIDFKTGRPKDKKWDSDATLYKYKLQLGFYKLLLNNSRTYKNYQVTEARIDFLTPDHTGKIHTKTYVFDDQDEAHLKQLIKIIYQNIKNLHFPPTDHYLEQNQENGLKAIKAFEQDLLNQPSKNKA